MKRREATKYLMAASVSAAAVTLDWTAAAVVSGPRLAERPVEQIANAPLLAVILDDRYAAARRFAEALAGDGTECLAVRGEAVTVWRDQCRPSLSRCAWRLAGMTTYCDFMLLRACARESGGRLVHLAQHDFRELDTIVHTLGASAWAETVTNQLRHDDWAARLAQALARKPMHAMDGEELTVRITGGGPASDRPGTLLSWVIASNRIHV